jgi:hypothetical protein
MEPELELSPPHAGENTVMQAAKMIAKPCTFLWKSFMAMAGIMVNVYPNVALQSLSERWMRCTFPSGGLPDPAKAVS